MVLALLLAAVLAPDTSKIVSLIGRFTSAHGCPIAEDTILTNAHVVDLRPFDAQIPLYPLRFSGGSFLPYKTSMREDLAIGNTDIKVPFYERATEAPQIGERIWWVGYSWKNKGEGFARRVLNGKVLRVVSNHVVIDTETEPGSSGSCLLNGEGKVVGILSWGVEMNNNTSVTVGVGVWGDLIQDLLKKPEPKANPLEDLIHLQTDPPVVP